MADDPDEAGPGMTLPPRPTAPGTQGRSELRSRAQLGCARPRACSASSAGRRRPPRRRRTRSHDPVGPRAVPLILGGLLLICCRAAGRRRPARRPRRGRGRRGRRPRPTGVDWKTVLPAGRRLRRQHRADRRRSAGSSPAPALLRLAPSPSAAATTSATWSSRWRCRSLTFYGFAIGLGVNLPAGILQGIL